MVAIHSDFAAVFENMLRVLPETRTVMAEFGFLPVPKRARLFNSNGRPQLLKIDSVGAVADNVIDTLVSPCIRRDNLRGHSPHLSSRNGEVDLPRSFLQRRLGCRKL